MNIRNPEEYLSIVTGIEIRRWGTEFVVHCLDDPVTRGAYTLLFTGCRDLRLSILDSELSGDVEADLIGVNLTQLADERQATVTTDIFEASVRYGTLVIRAAETG